jgi:arginine utilization protein RocB
MTEKPNPPPPSQNKMETLDQLKQTVRDWVKLDNEIRALNKEITTRRNDKKDISKRLIEVMRENQLDIFDIKDGQLMYVKKNKKKPITQKQLLSLFSNYYKDSSKAEELHNYIMDNREEVTEETIQRKIAKP